MMKFISKALSDVVQAAVAKLKEQDANKYKDLALETFIETIKDENYYDTAKNGGYDLIFSIWGGAAINPYGLMQVYCDTEFESNCEYGFKGKQNSIFLEIDYNENGTIEANEKRTFHDWYTFLNNEFTEQDREAPNFDQELYNKVHTEKLNILAGIEAGILNRFQAIPLYARNSADILSFKVDYITSQYINLIGYGGIRFMRFNYDDAKWADLIKTGKITYESYKD
jgi:oligopeptide transport system substrate-binding protein